MITCSVIVPTLNRVEDLRSCVASLLAQDISGLGWEVLIVDNGSTDATAEWSRSLERDANPRVRYILEPTPGLLAARHRGALEASGEVLVFIDDDIQATPGWLRTIHLAFQDPQISLVSGPSLPKYDLPPPPWIEQFWIATPYGGRACYFLSLLNIGETRITISADYMWGLNFAIRKYVLWKLGGFHPDTGPDHLQQYQGDGESGLAMKAEQHGLNLLYDPGVQIWHRVSASRMNIEYFEKRAYFQGICHSYTLERIKHGLYANKSNSAIQVVKNRLGALRRAMRRFVPAPSISHEFSEPQRRVRAAHERGYAFHQAAMQEDKSVREWVLRTDYWDYAIPGTKVE